MASLSYSELRRWLRKHDCHYVKPGKGSHEWWYSPITERRFSVPGNLKGEGTLQKIYKSSGVPKR